MKLFPKFRPLALISFFGIACLTVSFGQTTEVVFFETFGSTSPSGNNIGLYSQYGDNRGNVEASSYRIWFGDTVTNLGTGIQNPFFGFYSSDSSWDGIDGASGGNLLRFSEFSSTSSTTTQWYQFNAIPLTDHVGDSLAIEFLFRGLSPGAFPDVSDYFTLSISWDSVTFTEVELSFFNGIREGSGASDAWKSVVGTAQTMKASQCGFESLPIRPQPARFRRCFRRSEINCIRGRSARACHLCSDFRRTGFDRRAGHPPPPDGGRMILVGVISE